MSESTEQTAPRQGQADWDMTPYFSALGAADYLQFKETVSVEMTTLAKAMIQAPTLNAQYQQYWTALFIRLETLGAQVNHLDSYYGCLGAADSQNEDIKRGTAQFASTSAEYDKLLVMARSKLGQMPAEDFKRFIEQEKVLPVQYFIMRMREEAESSMGQDLESLSAELSVNGLGAWSRLYDQVSGTLEFDLEMPGTETQSLPVSMSRSLLEDSNAEVRQAALEGSAKAWQGVGDTVAASLNAIAGTRLTLYKKRGITDFLQPALFDAGITRKTLDTMMEVIRSRQALPQAYLRHKASLLGRTSMRFSDLMAPLPTQSESRVSWESGAAQVQKAFDSSYPALATLSQKAFDEKWIDYQPRPGKRPGGFCSSSQIIGQSRIFMTFNGGMGDVQTLAHELGHTFHSYLMRDMRPWASDYPMTLAETASTFAENIVTSAVLNDPASSTDTKKQILDQRLQMASAFMLNIPMRFDFECNFYNQRKSDELSVKQLQMLMNDAQIKNYGDSLDPNYLDPWFWASKLHFYISELSFYNFPYSFGYLFSMGIFARFLSEGSSFLPRYESLLMQTGSAPAETVANDALGVDLEAPAFWNASIDLIEKDWQQFQTL